MIERFLRLSPVMPVVTIEDHDLACDLAQALLRGGIRIVEVALRTPAALHAIESIARNVSGIEVGAGTVRTVTDLRAAENAGASFAVSPGTTETLLAEGLRARIPYLPGIATASELMVSLAAGYECVKFFPAGPSGGVATLEALAAPFPSARFCPTGGITQDSLSSYLRLPAVLCVGGSWVTPSEALAARDWGRIEALAAAAATARTMSAQRPESPA
jgi:2-dehydro-3-deoxyphosphogluconate aldolase/(4S)-4-hydroxy-2-oxoglutarate aldolase